MAIFLKTYQMKSKFLILFCALLSMQVFTQVGINTASPETTFEVAGKADDINHFDGILPPRITGDQLSRKSYSTSKKGAVVYVTVPSTIFSGQVINITEPGLYYFDGNLWQAVSKQKQTVEYQIILKFDSNSDAGLTATSGWTEPIDYWGDVNTYLTSTKSYGIGTKNFGGLQGSVSFRKIDGIVNVKFQISRESDSTPVSEDAFIDISDICADIGYFPANTVLVHPENSTFLIPVFLQNKTIFIPAANLSAISSNIVGETQGYSNWFRPN